MTIHFWYGLFRLGFAVVFIGLHIALMIGLLVAWRRDRRACAQGFSPKGFALKPGLPRVSVIIPVHNEQRCLPDLLQSLAVQAYPEAEFIFVDDRSSDASPEILWGFAGRFPEGTVQIITLQENPGPNYKQYALGKGIAAASGEFLLFTDADCQVPPMWIRSMLARMGDTQVGLTIGPVFKCSQEPGFLYQYQCFDHAVRYMYLAGSTGIGAAGGGFGNNLILREEALRSIGGYTAVPVSPTEDAALIARLRDCSAYQIRSAFGREVFVMTGIEHSWEDFTNQALRWNNGGLFSPDPATRFNFRVLMITISMGILALFVLPIVPSLWPLSGAVLVSMSLNTLATLRLFGSALPSKRSIYLIHLVFTPLYFTVLTILGFCRFKVTWKGSTLKTSWQQGKKQHAADYRE
ncbi:MAG: glycosyltransferase [Treponema sp.]|jgi:cellulose synthase/poly-beta-1,6-N-acetylglucosamine synthase-like glycosyltransferase|nr:glycosyltransferase [Treponema sp.]